MPTSGIEDTAMRLLRAFYSISGGKPNEPLHLGEPNTPPTESPVKAAGIDFGSPELDVAVRYLLDQGCIEETDVRDAYTITVPGIDRARNTYRG